MYEIFTDSSLLIVSVFLLAPQEFWKWKQVSLENTLMFSALELNISKNIEEQVWHSYKGTVYSFKLFKVCHRGKKECQETRLVSYKNHFILILRH